MNTSYDPSYDCFSVEVNTNSQDYTVGIFITSVTSVQQLKVLLMKEVLTNGQMEDISISFGDTSMSFKIENNAGRSSYWVLQGFLFDAADYFCSMELRRAGNYLS